MNKFVILYRDNTVRAVTEQEVSLLIDLADSIDTHEVRAIYAADEHGRLAEVKVAALRNYNDYDTSAGVYYASSKMTAGKRTVGYVHYSDH